jgi:hypothetical protein
MTVEWTKPVTFVAFFCKIEIPSGDDEIKHVGKLAVAAGCSPAI